MRPGDAQPILLLSCEGARGDPIGQQSAQGQPGAPGEDPSALQGGAGDPLGVEGEGEPRAGLAQPSQRMQGEAEAFRPRPASPDARREAGRLRIRIGEQPDRLRLFQQGLSARRIRLRILGLQPLEKAAERDLQEPRLFFNAHGALPDPPKGNG
jgi:hypothetical protein